VAKFHGDRPTELGDLAAKQKKKRKTSAVKHKPAWNYRSGWPKKSQCAAASNEENCLQYSHEMFTLRGLSVVSLVSWHKEAYIIDHKISDRPLFNCFVRKHCLFVHDEFVSISVNYCKILWRYNTQFIALLELYTYRQLLMSVDKLSHL